MVNPVHHLSNLLGLAAAVMLFVLIITGSESLVSIITSGGLMAVGFAWSGLVYDDPVTPRGFVLAIIYMILLIVWGITAAVTGS